MLIDDYIAATSMGIDRPDLVWAHRDEWDRRRLVTQERHTLAALTRCEPFVLSPLTIETADSLARYQARQLGEQAQYLHLPDYHTWIDMSAQRPAGACDGRRTGVLLIGNARDGNILSGEALIVTDAVDGYAQLSGRFDLTTGMLWQSVAGERGADQQTQHYKDRGGDPEQLISTVWAAIALINTPRISIRGTVEFGRLNKRRAASGRPPILSYTTVRIAIDRGEVGPAVALSGGGERALHRVRAFLRLRRGRVELVRPHFRGNPRFGVVKHRYLAFRAEDEAGAWTGGPLPGKQVIREMLDGE